MRVKNLIYIILHIIILWLFFIILPMYLTVPSQISLKILFLFYLTNTLLIFYFFKKHSKGKNNLQLHLQDLQEKINILRNKNQQELQIKLGLEKRIARYNSLRKILEKINQNLSLESIAQAIVEDAFSLIADNKGVGILYLINGKTQRLNLFKSKKEDRKLVVKTKEGDIFDFWVLRHNNPLLIEDTRSDFRFDLEKLTAQETRPIASLISAPLISEKRFLGILRLDNPFPGFYSQDDLRFLLAICDLGAVALENGEFFEKTQELAIHDELTSLYTKGYFLERLQEECRRCMRRNISSSLLMVDIDHFKNYNDKFGHTAGDIVLKTLGALFVEFFKELNHIISRFGGEEFCIILSGVDKKKAFMLAEKLRIKIEATDIVLRQQKTKVTVSIGLASFPLDTNDADEFIHRADRAMYEAKQKGRNRVVEAISIKKC